MENNPQLQINHISHTESNVPTLIKMYETRFLSDCKIVNSLTKCEYK